MEGFGGHLEFTRYVAHGLTSERFTLFDIGCSGGIGGWRSLGEKLNAFGSIQISTKSAGYAKLKVRSTLVIGPVI